MKTFKYYHHISKDFTGICKILENKTIHYIKNGKHHREDGPAIIYPSGHKQWQLNGVSHREVGPAVESVTGYKEWWYKGLCYGINNKFTNTTWFKKVKQLKREEGLKIFI